MEKGEDKEERKGKGKRKEGEGEGESWKVFIANHHGTGSVQ